MDFIVRAKLKPPAIFGLPDGDMVVVPIGPDGQTNITGPNLDTLTGKIAGYGTLSEFRKPDHAVDVGFSGATISLNVRDNFVSVQLHSDSAQEALERASEFLDRFCQCISVQVGQRVFASLESLEDGQGKLHHAYIRRTVPLFSAAVYNLKQLQTQLQSSFHWASVLDERAGKALFYFEHAHLLYEFSKNLPVHSPHAAFSLGTAFLQMFKGLVTVVGEPGVDSDHQRRAKRLGLGADFWATRVQPLCKIRNDDDVAHYSLKSPDLAAAHRQFAEAGGTFREAFAAYVCFLRDGEEAGGRG